MDDIFEIKAIVLQLEGASDSLKDALLKHPQVLLVKRFIEFISEPVVVCKWYSTGKMDGSRTFGKPLNFPGTETDWVRRQFYDSKKVINIHKAL